MARSARIIEGHWGVRTWWKVIFLMLLSCAASLFVASYSGLLVHSKKEASLLRIWREKSKDINTMEREALAGNPDLIRKRVKELAIDFARIKAESGEDPDELRKRLKAGGIMFDPEKFSDRIIRTLTEGQEEDDANNSDPGDDSDSK